MKIGVFSDVHGVIGIFNDTINMLKEAGAEKIVYLGDAIGYVPHLEAFRAWKNADVLSIRGNHEQMLIDDNIDMKKDIVYQLSKIQSDLEAVDRQFLQKLPKQLSMTLDKHHFLFIHGSPNDPVKGYVYPDTDLSQFNSSCEFYDVIFMGNTHRPFSRKINNKVFVNVGSAGLPRDDSHKGCACLFDCISLQPTFLKFSLGQYAITTLEQSQPAPSIVRYLEKYIGVKHEPSK